jgi:pimeloyl-ACP methyl ester carboxylesterase/quinol monooxygenase YgiN
MEEINPVLDAGSDARTPHVPIRRGYSGATFIQLWQMPSADEQHSWLETMRRNIHLLQVQPGFASMSLHLSLDGRNVVVYAQWDSEEALKAAVDRPEVKAARLELDSHGVPEGALYSTEFVSSSRPSSSAGIQIEPHSTGVVFVNVWTVPDRDHQQKLLAAMKSETADITSKPGSGGMALHASLDGKSVVAYAPWDSLEAFDRAITRDHGAQANRVTLAQLGQPQPNTYRVESVNLSLIADPDLLPADVALRNRCQARWAARGFSTRTVRVNGVTLHVAEAGHGDPVLLLHGYPQSGEAWRLVAPDLAKRHRVVIPDLRGMGLSEAARSGYDLGNLSEDIHQLVLSLNIAKIKVVGHDWGGAVGAVYAMRYRDEVTHLAFIESAVAGAGFETLWNFSQPNGVFAFIPFLLMGDGNPASDTTVALLQGRESIFLHHLWATFTGDQAIAPFAEWSIYVEAMARSGIAASSSSYYRAAYSSADQVRALIEKKLEIPVLAIAGKEGIGDSHEALVRAFAANLVDNIIVPGAGHFVPEERPLELRAALETFF